MQEGADVLLRPGAEKSRQADAGGGGGAAEEADGHHGGAAVEEHLQRQRHPPPVCGRFLSRLLRLTQCLLVTLGRCNLYLSNLYLSGLDGCACHALKDLSIL